MALQSKLFRGDSKLDDALVSDPAHIVPGANGPHVAKIQQALVRLDGAGIAADGAYGPKTAAAVGAFKRKRNILNTQGQIDDIVGKKTMAALDGEMLAKEQSGLNALRNVKPGVFRQAGKPAIVIVPSFQSSERIQGGANPSGGGAARRLAVVGDNGGDPSLQSLVPLKIVPFNEPLNSFILAKSEELPKGRDGLKNDLDTNFPPTLPLLPAEKLRIEELEQDMRNRRILNETQFLENLARNEAFIANQSDGTALMNAFFSNQDPGRFDPFNVGSSVSTRVANSNGFAKEHRGVTADITAALQKQFLTGTIDYRLMRGFGGPFKKAGVAIANPANGVKEPPEVGFNLLQGEPALVALIGSFQAATVILKSFDVDASSLTFRATLRYELIDHFGVDNSDVVFDFKGHGTRGQIAFWILQHKHRPGHVPYRFKVIVEASISDTLLDPNLFPPTDFADLLRQSGLLPGL